MVEPPALFILTAAERVTPDQRTVGQNYASRAKQVIYKKWRQGKTRRKDAGRTRSVKKQQTQNRFQLDVSEGRHDVHTLSVHLSQQ